jgi:integrase/recombinase XerD
MPRKVRRQRIAIDQLPKEMVTAMEAYLDWLTVRNYSNYTIVERRYYIGLFIEWAEQRSITAPHAVTLVILESYQRHVHHLHTEQGKPYSILGQRARLIALNTWFAWLKQHKRLAENPATDLVLPKMGNRLPKAVLTLDEVETIMTQPNLDSPLGLRDRAILETFYSTGMRRTELAELSIHDLDTDRRAVTIRHGKGDKQRVVPIGQRALTWLLAYMENARPLLLVDRRETRLFITKNGLRFVPNALSDLVKKHMRSAGITKGGSCHLFRHTAATFMLENGADMRYIQALLGHADLNATQIYTHVSIVKLREVHDRTHPAKIRPEAVDRGPKEDDGEDGDLVTV